MSVCGQSGQTEEDSASEEVGASATRDIYKQKPASKVVRVLTVLAYLLSVSLAAILLSVYYICVWKSPELPLEAPLKAPQKAPHGEMNALRENRTDYRQTEYTPMNTYGGGDTAINGGIVQSPPAIITTEDSVATEPTTDTTFNATALPDTTPEIHNGTTDNSSLDDTDSIT